MKELVLPVPERVSAAYIVPVTAPMTAVEVRRRAGRASAASLTGPLRTLTAEWLAKGTVKVEAEPARPAPPGLLDKPHFGTPEQRRFLARARTIVRFSATQRTSLIGIQEWQARGPAAALADDPAIPPPSSRKSPGLGGHAECMPGRRRALSPKHGADAAWPWPSVESRR
jgi:hypothetical protein